MSETPDLSYEEARDQLVAVVRELESGNVPLSRSMELWSRGEALAAVCQRWLDGARETIRRAQGPAPAAGSPEQPE
nr:exodeoxyribonuclease VII small subunit [Propionibacterium sp.]